MDGMYWTSWRVCGSEISLLSKFNSGRFAVPWKDTEGVLKEMGIPMTIYTPISTSS